MTADEVITKPIRYNRCFEYNPPVKISLENTNAIMATDMQRFNLLLFNGNLNPSSSTIGGTIIKNHRGKPDLSDTIAGKSTPAKTNEDIVSTLNNSGTIRHSKADKSVALTLKS